MGDCDLLGWGADGGGQGGVLGLERDRRQTQMFTRWGVATQTLKWGQVGKGSREPIWVLVTEREKGGGRGAQAKPWRQRHHLPLHTEGTSSRQQPGCFPLVALLKNPMFGVIPTCPALP